MFHQFMLHQTVPNLSYSSIPNLNDYVILTNDGIAIIEDLFYFPEDDMILYLVRDFRTQQLIKNIKLKHMV